MKKKKPCWHHCLTFQQNLRGKKAWQFQSSQLRVSNFRTDFGADETEAKVCAAPNKPRPPPKARRGPRGMPAMICAPKKKGISKAARMTAGPHYPPRKERSPKPKKPKVKKEVVEPPIVTKGPLDQVFERQR